MGDEDVNRADVTPLDDVAHFTIEASEGYVQIEQSHGGQVYYTPDEAREIAEDILEAVTQAPDSTEEPSKRGTGEGE